MQSTLEHVATQQIEVLRKGVADMFVTLARRNRSLIDRQLAMIDTLERNEENPDTLADFYQLDHLATRMRRNAESLLVLAGSEPQKKWRTPMEVDDVVRAALGEVEDYRRIDVLALEAVRLKGSVVADLAHLLSELLENATSFSPPETRVRIAGHFHDDGYLITITDRGVGVPARRLGELNELLSRPPVVGLAPVPVGRAAVPRHLLLGLLRRDEEMELVEIAGLGVPRVLAALAQGIGEHALALAPDLLRLVR